MMAFFTLLGTICEAKLEPKSEIRKYIDGDLEKKNFMESFEDLRPDLFFPEAWNETQKAEAAELVRPQRVKTGMLSSIPMTCRGSKCPYAEICPLLEKGLVPEGRACPIELAMVKEFFDSYVEELDVDTTKMVEVSMVRDLVNQEIQQNRSTWLLSLQHFIQENVMGVDADGRPIYRKELHFAVDYEDRIYKRKEKLRSALLATREARARAGQGNLDNAQVIANLMEDIRKTDRLKEEALRKKLGIADVDEYIEAEVIEAVDEPDIED